MDRSTATIYTAYFDILGFNHQQLVVCKSCRYCVIPNHIAGHLKSAAHKATSKLADTIQDQLIDLSDQLNLINLQDLLDLPDQLDRPIDQLASYSGYRCRYCTYSAIAKTAVQQHRNRVHPEHRIKRGGFKDRGSNDQHEISAQIQRFFQSGPRSSYISIRSDPNRSDETTSNPPRDQQIDAIANLLASSQQTFAEDLADQISGGPELGTEDSGFLRTTGWHRLVSDRVRGSDLSDLFDPPRILPIHGYQQIYLN